MIRFVEEIEERLKISEAILSDLTDWFGMPEYTQNYIADSSNMPFWAACDGEKSIGFAALK